MLRMFGSLGCRQDLGRREQLAGLSACLLINSASLRHLQHPAAADEVIGKLVISLELASGDSSHMITRITTRL